MPAVPLFLYGLGAAAASVFGVVGWAAGIAIGSSIIALSVAAVRRVANLDDPADAGYTSGQQISIRSTEAPRNMVYGETNVGGVFTYANTTGTEARELYYELVHTGHEIDSFIGWFLDDKYIPIADVDVSDGSVDTNTGGHGLDDVASGPVLYLRGAIGTSTQTVDSMLDSAFSVITSNHRHRGCARTVVRCDLLVGFESKWNGRAPGTISAVIRGKKVYDPRADTTFPGGSGAQRLATPSTWVWSDNPALIWADYRITAAPLGPGWDSDRIDYQSVFDAANHCDVAAAIPTATTEKRFRCDLVVDTSMEPDEVVSKILATMAGSQRQFGGQWHVYAGVWSTPDFVLDESDLVGPIQFRKQPDTSSKDRYNQVKGEYFDRDRLWKRSPFVTVNNTTLRTDRDNGRTMPNHLSLDGVSREYQAQRLALRALNQADDSGICVFSAGYSAANIRVGDTGTVTVNEFGWGTKSFRCVGVRAIDFLGYELKLKEDASGNYADPAEGEYSTRTPAGDIVFGTVNPWYLASPNGAWAITSTFSSTDADTVAWTSGSFILVNGTTYSIASGNTGNMGARTYIYFDPGASSTVLQTTTTAATAVGPGKSIVAVAAPSTIDPGAFFQVFGGGGGILVRTNEIGAEAATEASSATDAGPITATLAGAATDAVYQIRYVELTLDDTYTVEVTASYRVGVNSPGGAGWTVTHGVARMNTAGTSVGFAQAIDKNGVNLYEPAASSGQFVQAGGTYRFGLGCRIQDVTGSDVDAIFRDITVSVTVIKR